ncbi:RDD family protein [Calycomorphotria hydatis]|uniref:RDD family protein n=1 Tax=Calycomorphotria hydatis TaxID=2528027 RepID=A0A517T7L0_9PLAN|nr:RDD family protein [Calycomorphotria hydatis]QDT64361.1 RDD family protein [Calycomorphotria hydatis]
MPNFLIRGTAPNGERKKGTVSADSVSELLNKMGRKGWKGIEVISEQEEEVLTAEPDDPEVTPVVSKRRSSTQKTSPQKRTRKSLPSEAKRSTNRKRKREVVPVVEDDYEVYDEPVEIYEEEADVVTDDYGYETDYGDAADWEAGEEYDPDAEGEWENTSNFTGDRKAKKLEYGPPGSRLLARIVDNLICFFIWFAIGMVIALLTGVLVRGMEEEELSKVFATLLLLLYFIGVPIVFGLYHTLFYCSRLQATPGKLLLKLYVTDTDGKPISFGRSVGRFVIDIAHTYVLMGFGNLAIFFNKKNQSLHDMAAGTVVLSSRAEKQKKSKSSTSKRSSKRRR